MLGSAQGETETHRREHNREAYSHDSKFLHACLRGGEWILQHVKQIENDSCAEEERHVADHDRDKIPGGEAHSHRSGQNTTSRTGRIIDLIVVVTGDIIHFKPLKHDVEEGPEHGLREALV